MENNKYYIVITDYQVDDYAFYDFYFKLFDDYDKALVYYDKEKVRAFECTDCYYNRDVFEEDYSLKNGTTPYDDNNKCFKQFSITNDIENDNYSNNHYDITVYEVELNK